MKKFFSLFAFLILVSLTTSSCGLFGGGKSERCPAYSAIPSGDSDSNWCASQLEEVKENN